MAGIMPSYTPEQYPGEVRPRAFDDPIMKAMETVGPDKGLAPVKTVQDAIDLQNQLTTFAQSIPTMIQQQALYGVPKQELADKLGEDDRSFLGKAFDYISAPFRYETSVFTAPVVSAIEAATTDKSFSDIYPTVQKEALTGDREVSVYDALRRAGMSNWGAVPLGIGADILLSPSTYLGVGGLTKLGKLAKATTYAGRAGEVIDPASKVGAAMAELVAKVGAGEADSLLKLAPTMSEQAGLGQRALLKWAGIPIVEGEKGFKILEDVGNVLRENPAYSKLARGLSTSFRPAGVDPGDWAEYLDLNRARKGSVGLRSNELLEEIKAAAAEGGLTPQELEEIFYTMSKRGAIPWDKVAATDVPEATLTSALKTKFPGLTPKINSLGQTEFDALAESLGIKSPGEAFRTGELSGETILNTLKDPELSAAHQAKWDQVLQRTQEGRNILEVLPPKVKDSLAKAYKVDSITPEIEIQFGKDWEKFSAGMDTYLSPKFIKWTESLIKEGSHLKVPGVVDITLPDGTLRRIVGDIKFVDEAQESVRVFAKEMFQKIFKEESSLGILNKSIDDYVPGIYRLKATPFRGVKEFIQRASFQSEKKFATPVEAEIAGYEPLKNILELVGIRAQRSIQVQETYKMLNEVKDLFGIPTRDTLSKMSVEDWGKIGKAGVNPENYAELTAHLRKMGYVPFEINKAEYFFQPEIAETLNKMIQPFVNDETTRMFLSLYDKSLNVWKGYVTAINPKFHMRNFASNNFLLYLKDGFQGINPIRHKMALDIIRGADGELATDIGRSIPYEEVRQMLAKTGVRGSGFMGGEMSGGFPSLLKDALDPSLMASKKVNPLSSHNIAIEFGRKFGTKVEDEAKVVGFINDLIQHGNPQKAAENTYKYMYDYMDLTSFEKNVAKRLIPFWTWTSKNIPAMLSNLVSQPGKMGAAVAKVPMVFEHKAAANMREEGVNFPETIRPQYLKEQGAFPVSTTKEGKALYYNPGLPYQDLNRLSPRELLSGVTPVLKPLIEGLPPGGYSMFMDRPYETYKGQMVEAPLGSSLLPKFLQDKLGMRQEKGGTYMPGESAAIANTFLPMLRSPQKLINKPDLINFISEVAGQKFMEVDPNQERRSALYEWMKKVEDTRKVEKGISRKEGKRAVEAAGEGELSGEELKRLWALKFGPRGIGK